MILLKGGGDRIVVPWYQRCGTWYNIANVVEPGTKRRGTGTKPI